MNHRRVNFALKLAAAGLAATAVGVPIVGLRAPVEPDAAGPSPVVAPVRVRPTSVPSLDSFGPILDRPFRPAAATPGLPAVAAIPPAAGPAPAPPTPSALAGVSLVGTVGTSIALVRMSDGTVAAVEAGDEVEGASVVSVGRSLIVFRAANRLVALRTPPPPVEDRIIVPVP